MTRDINIAKPPKITAPRKKIAFDIVSVEVDVIFALEELSASAVLRPKRPKYIEQITISNVAKTANNMALIITAERHMPISDL